MIVPYDNIPVIRGNRGAPMTRDDFDLIARSQGMVGILDGKMAMFLIKLRD